MLILKESVKFSFVEKSVSLSQLTLLTENSVANCHFSKKYILEIIRNSNKARGNDMIITHMLKLCDDSLYKP